MTVIPIIGIISKNLERKQWELEIPGRLVMAWFMVSFRSAEIVRHVLENCANLLSFRLQWSTPSVTLSKNLRNKNKRITLRKMMEFQLAFARLTIMKNTNHRMFKLRLVIQHRKECSPRFKIITVQALVVVDWIGLVWFSLVLRHINHYRLFNAKSIVIHINSSISTNPV